MKNIFFYLALILICGVSYSQNKKEKTQPTQNSTAVTSTSSSSATPTSNSQNISREKQTFPPNQKVGPAVFYIKNDQPISEEDFRKELVKGAQKH